MGMIFSFMGAVTLWLDAGTALRTWLVVLPFAGVILDILAMWLKAFVSPAFFWLHLPGGGLYEVNPTWRGGVAFFPFKSLCLAADIDLTKNPSQILFDYESREYSLGAEFGMNFFAVRAGITGNILDDDDQLDYALGFGVGAGKVFQLDFAISLDEVEDLETLPDLIQDFDPSSLEDQDFPDGIAVGVALRFNVQF